LRSESSVSLEEFFASVESESRIGKWQDKNNFEIADLKLNDSAKHFYQGCLELHTQEATWQKFKDTFRQRYKDVRTDQYHYMMLQTARQGKMKTLIGLQIGVELCPRKFYARRTIP